MGSGVTPRQMQRVAHATRGKAPAPRLDSESGCAELAAGLVEAGASLLEALDAAGAAPDTAFWLRFRDVDDWRLVLGGGRLVRHGPRIAHSRIRRILAESARFDPLTMQLIGVAKPDAQVVRILRSALRTGPGIHGVRIRDNVLNGVRVQEAYVYRVM